MVVICVHVVLIGGVVLMQGCGRTVSPATSATSEELVMPPASPQAVVDMPVQPAVPASVMAPAPVNEPPAKSWPVDTTTYVVRNGDSVSKIASHYRLSAAEIVALNNLKDPNRVRVGQKLILPGKVDVSAPAPATVKKAHAAAPAASKASSSTKAASSGKGNYVVQKGDSLSVIAQKHGTTVAAIKRANNMTSDRLTAGQKLVVESGTKSASAVAAAPAGSRPPEPLPAVAPVAPAAPTPVDLPVPAPAPAVTGAVPAAVSTGAAPVVSAPTAPAADAYRVYVVGENEDLYSVGLLWNVSVNKLKEVNGLTDTKLTAGQRLKIPAAE
jgi:peptidoglycan endopeptidase LytE